MLGEALSAVRETIRDNDPGRRTWPPIVGSAPALRKCKNQGTSSTAAEPLTAASARKASPSSFPTYFSDALVN